MSLRVLAFAFASCLVLSPALAWAEEAPAPAPQPAPEPAPEPAPKPEPKPEPEEEFVDHTGYDMAMAEGGLPQGWTLGEGDAAAKEENALKDAVLALAKSAGAPEDGVHGVTRSANAPAGRAVFLLVDVDKPEPAFAKALTAAATEKGWVVRTMGASTRFLVVAAPEAVRLPAVEAQTRWAARMLAMKAWSAVEYRNADRAVLLARAALAMDAKSAGANFVLGVIATDMAQEKRDPKGFAAAVERLRAALASDASSPLTGSQAVSALGALGTALLLMGGKDAEERDALKKAVAGASELDRAGAMGNLYNLACAHARLKELDEAFTHLTAVLAQHAKEPIRGIDHWRKDPDFANLQADPRWAKLLETYGAAAAPKDD